MVSWPWWEGVSSGVHYISLPLIGADKHPVTVTEPTHSEPRSDLFFSKVTICFHSFFIYWFFVLLCHLELCRSGQSDYRTGPFCAGAVYIFNSASVWLSLTPWKVVFKCVVWDHHLWTVEVGLIYSCGPHQSFTSNTGPFCSDSYLNLGLKPLAPGPFDGHT